jgi:hypothetical protein
MKLSSFLKILGKFIALFFWNCQNLASRFANM